MSDKAHAKVHSVYETTMIGRHGRDLIKMIPAARTNDVAEIVPGGTPTGRNAAEAVVALMQRTVKRLPPLTIVDVFDANMGRSQVDMLWAKLKDPTAACMQDGAKTLARVWEAAWRAGSGEDQAQGGKFDQDDLRKLYENSKFLPAYELQTVTLDPNDRIVSTAGGSGGAGSASAAPASTARRRTAKKSAAAADRRSGRAAAAPGGGRKRAPAKSRARKRSARG